VRRAELSLTLIGACLIMTGGCVTSSQTTGTGDVPYGFIACEDPRPEACTMEYDPVCGVQQAGNTKTYSTGCTACSDPAVIGYGRGGCIGSDG
jgi:hypothetical protein